MKRTDTAPSNDPGTLVQDCSGEIACPHPPTVADKDANDHTLYWAEVYGKTNGSTVIVAHSQDVTVAPACAPSPEVAVHARRRPRVRPEALACEFGETIHVKPGLTTKDMVTPKTSLNGMHTLAISGAISHTFTGTDGKQRTQCEDYLYAETVDGVFDCSAPWPQPDGQNTFRVEDDTSLVLVLNTCQAYPCNLDNQLSPPSPRPDYNPQHTYTTTIDNGDIIGTTAFWASPLGFLDQNTHVQTGFSGGFAITISPAE
jgi:hypothetical protein